MKFSDEREEQRYQAVLALEAQLAASAKRIRELEEALKPFAVHGEWIAVNFPEEADDTIAAGFVESPITLGDFRRARLALSHTKEGEG